jgi:O-antigen ligase
LAKIREVNPVFGEGLGGYYSWKLGSHEINFSPHNAYVQMMLKFGLLGGLIYMLMITHFFRKALAMRKKLPQGPMRAFLEVGMVCFGAGHGYMMGYAFEPIILYFFAVATTAASLSHQSLREYRQFRLQNPVSDERIPQASLPPVTEMIPRSF